MALQKTPSTPSPAIASVSGPTVKPPSAKRGIPSGSKPFWVGLGVSVSWVALVLGVVAKAGASHTIAGTPLVDWAVGVSAAVSPVAMVWMVTAYLQRAADIQSIAEPLRRQLTLITGESGAADARIRRFNQAIREQVELLRSAQTISRDDLEAIMDRVRQHRSDLERFESVSTNQVKEIQDVIRRSMFQVEQMMDDKFTMLRVLDGKLQSNGDGVARQVESVRDQVARMLEEVENTSAQMADSLERAQRDSKKLADTSRLQESSLTGAAEAAAETLSGLSSKIDLSVATFLERASAARQEAERLAHALDAQTRALDDFSSTLPTRVSEAESVLRGVADRLYASEKMASEQAVHLSEKLSQQVDGLQGFMDRFTARLSDIDTGLDRRHTDLNALAERIGSTTNNFVSSWEKSLMDLDDRTGNSLLRFTVVNDETRRNADSVVAHLAETTSKYEDVVIRMRALSSDSSLQMKGMTEEVARHLSQFESLSKASNKAGEEVQERANAALQGLQHVLERVLTARDAMQAVGETLVKDIYNAVDQNEKMINRLSETAQMGARAMGAATEALSRQEVDLVGKVRAGEAVLLESVDKIQKQAEISSKDLREQTATLMTLLAEAQSQLVATDHKLHSFATQAVVPVQKAIQQIDASADQSLRSIGQYGEGLSQQVNRLQEFHTRIGGMSQEMGKATAESAGVFEQLTSRFAATRTQQEESARQTMAQFADLSDRMQREISGLDGQAAHAVEVLQQAALKVGEQSYQMLENAKGAGAQMKDVTTALQVEAQQIQTILRKQTEEIGGDLARAEQKFTTIGETIRERADAAYALLDRVAAHYGDVSSETLTQAEQRLTGVGEVIRDRADTACAAVDRAAAHYSEIAQTAFTQAEHRFTAMGETIRDRAEAATVMLDRATAHYNVVSQTTTQDMEERTQKLEQVVSHAQNKVDYLSTALNQQTQQIEADATRIETHASEIAATSGRAVQNLSLLNDKLSVTHEAAATHAQSTLTKLDETTASFARRSQEITEAAEAATGAVVKAGSTFGEQTGKLIDNSHQIDGVLRQLTSATGALADQAAQIRIGMEQQNNRLLSQLVDSVAQMDVTGGKLQQLVTVATQGADTASLRFADMTETAAQRLGTSTSELQGMAERAESTLAALGANITQQAASLSVVGEQMGEQQRVLAIANESQRTQLVELFDKLGAAHKQASDVAERSITYLTDSLQEIHRQMGLIGDQSQQAVGTVKLASMGFSEQSAALLQNAQAAEQQARNVLTVTSALQEQARHLRETLQAESERAGESLGVLLGRLTSSGSEVRDLGTSTGAVLSTLQRALGEQTNELGTSMQHISERQRSLGAALDQQREVINGLLNRLVLAQDETASVAERTAARLNDSAQQITRNAETIDQSAQSALLNVQAAASGFAQESEGIEIHARQAEQQSRQIFAAAAGLHGQISDLRTSMQSEGERTNLVLGTLLDKVSSGAAEMRDLGAATEMSLASLGNNVAQQSAALTSSMQQIGDRQRSLALSLDAQRDVVNGLLNRLTLAQDETASVAEKTASRLSEGAQQITHYVETLDTRAQSALVNVQAATESFAKEAAAIDAQARQAEEQARSILATTTGLHEQISAVRASMQNDSDRSSEKLDGLLGKLSAGSSEIRDAGSFAESTLASMQVALGTQATEMGVVLQKISDRQNVLTTALDAQRDAINGILNRLTLAQDETVAVADRTTARLNDNAEQITRQLDLIGTQATSTLAKVEASVTGFAEQASALNLQGQQAEQQMRGVLSVTAGMQEQARHLREAMQVETARVVEHFSAVIAQLDTTSAYLKTESGAAVHTLDQAAQQFASTTQSGAEMIRSQSELLAQTADQSEARMSNAGEKIRSHLRLIGEVGDKTEAQAQHLANTAEFATTRLVSLRDTLGATENDGRGIMSVTSQHIEEVRAALQSELQRLTEMSDKAVADVSGAAQNLAAQSDSLRANLASSESALTEAAALVREEAAHLPATLTRSVAEIESTTRALKGCASDADAALIGTADRFISVTAAARGNMIEELQRVGSVADDADKILRHFNTLLGEQVAAMQQSTALLSSEQQDLVEKAGISVGALAQASDRLTTLRGEAAVTAERLAHEFSQLDQRATASTVRLNAAGEGVARQIEAINDAASRAETQLTGAGDNFREQLERIRTGLQGQIDDINRGLMQITAQLERTGASLRSTTVGAVGDIERIGQRFDQTGGEAADQIEARTQQMRTATEDVAKLLSGFDHQFGAMLERLASAGEGIKGQQSGSVQQLQTLLAHLGTVAERLEAAREMSGNVSQHAIERLDDVVNAVQAHMNNMSAGAQTAAGIMRGIGQIYGDQTQNLSKGVGEAHNQVMTMNKSIDEMQERTDRMRTSLKIQSDELMTSLRQILVQLEMTGDGLSEAVDRTLQQQAADNLKKMG